MNQTVMKVRGKHVNEMIGNKAQTPKRKYYALVCAISNIEETSEQSDSRHSNE